jgi:hypothetical protein
VSTTRPFEGLRARVAEEIGADDMRVDVDLGASEAQEVPLSHVSARAVEAVRLLMINSLNLETLMRFIPKRRFVGMDDHPSQSERGRMKLGFTCQKLPGRLAAAFPNCRNNLVLAGSVPGRATFTAIFYVAEAALRLVLIFRK